MASAHPFAVYLETFTFVMYVDTEQLCVSFCLAARNKVERLGAVTFVPLFQYSPVTSLLSAEVCPLPLS